MIFATFYTRNETHEGTCIVRLGYVLYIARYQLRQTNGDGIKRRDWRVVLSNFAHPSSLLWTKMSRFSKM